MYNERFDSFLALVKGVLLALGVSLLCTVIFANILRAGGVNERAIYPVNQTIKAIAIAIAALVFVRGEKGWRKGLLLGLFFTLLSYLTFSAVGGSFALSYLAILELAIGLFVGAVSGILAVNLKRN